MLFFLPILTYSYEDVKCLTFPIKKSQKLKDQIQGVINFDSTGRPKNQCVAYSKKGLFAIHYDTSGINKVPTLDLNFNGIPEFVDSALFYLERAYSIYVDSMGFDPPPKDSLRGGTDAYDFYLWDIGNGFYDEVAYGWTVCDIEIKTPFVFPRYACFSVIDNDFSPYDTTFFTNGTKRATFRETGYLGLNITLAHELHHFFQFGYGDPLFPSFNEMTSTFMEYRVCPRTKDYLQFVKSLFSDFSKYVLSDPTYYVGYRYAIFLQYLYKKFGDYPIVELWKNIGRGNAPLHSLELALNNIGTSISEEIANFLPYIHYSGIYYKNDYLPNGQLFPPVKYLFEGTFDKSLIINQRMKPLEIRPLRVFFPSENPETLDDTLFIFLANLDSKNAIQQNLDSLRECSIVLSLYNTSGIRLYPKEVYYEFIGDRKLFADSLFMNFGYKTYAMYFPFPNPCRLSKEPISFPVPTTVSFKDEVEFRVYDSYMNEIQLPKNSYNISIINKRRVIHFDRFPIELPTGVYFFKVSFKDTHLFGKFTVVD
ncbi:MAG: hypothetical protein N2560_09565 [Ignavibacteria bacterium]|nr:hypothetical protein [Ignavibacteria bacterium]